MPTYEYECEKCKRTFEVEQRITEPPLTRCTLNTGGGTFSAEGGVWCGGEVKRLIPAATSFVLKGPGWFKDGY